MEQINGDVNYWEHGGTFFSPKQNVLYHIDGTDDTNRGALQNLFCIDVDEINLDEWYDLWAVKRYVGGDDDYFNLPDHIIWCDIASYYGWNGLDYDPLKINKTYLNKLLRHK